MAKESSTSSSLWVILLLIVSPFTFKFSVEMIHIKYLEYDLDIVATQHMVAPPDLLSFFGSNQRKPISYLFTAAVEVSFTLSSPCPLPLNI